MGHSGNISRLFTWYDRCNYSAVTHTIREPESHSFTHRSTKRGANLEDRNEDP